MSLRVAYETEKKEDKIDLLNKENTILEQQQSIDKGIKYGMGAGMLALLAILGLSWNLSRNRKTRLMQQAQLHDREKELYQMEQERAAEREAILTAQHATQIAENKLLQNQMEAEKQEVVNKAMQLAAQNKQLNYIQGKLKSIESSLQTDPKNQFSELQTYLSEATNQLDSWEGVKVHLDKVLPGFFDRLRQTSPAKLSDMEERFCAYTRLRMTTAQISELMSISRNTVFKNRQRLKAKFELESTEELDEFIISV